MNTTNRDPQFVALIKGINLRYLLSSYLFLKPGASQGEIAKRLNVGQMTVSRMLTKDYAIKDDWVPVLADMLYELSELGIENYVSQMEKILSASLDVTRIENYRKLGSLVYDNLLSSESRDFEFVGANGNGFNFFSWDKKITWSFVDIGDSVSLNPIVRPIRNKKLDFYLSKYFPQRTDRVTLFTSSKLAYQYVLKWYAWIDWTDPKAEYCKHQKHSIILIDNQFKTIEQNQELTHNL